MNDVSSGWTRCDECNVFVRKLRRHKERNRCKAVRERRMNRGGKK